MSIKKNKLISLLFCVFLLCLHCSLCMAAGGKYGVEDEAQLFSNAARLEANRIIGDIQKNTRPTKDVLLITKPALPSDQTSADTFARTLFKEHKVSGILVLIVKDPHKIVVVVGAETEERFTKENELREHFLAGFRQKRFDNGLIGGIRFAASELMKDFSPGMVPANNDRYSNQLASRRLNAGDEENKGSSFSWLTVLLVVVACIFLFRLLTRVMGGGASTGMGMGGGNVYPGATGVGGGFISSILGGGFGAVAGNWLYDRFFGTSPAMAHEPLGMSDAGIGGRDDSQEAAYLGGEDVGTSTSGDWGGEDGSGGAFDSDSFSGGVDSTGGDW
ncbi:MAG: TPM domain-containing protein [Pseudomonadota bacterium]